MKKTKELTKDELLHLAKLANLELTDKEIDKYAKQLSETIDYVENLKELKTEDITLTSSTVNTTNVFFKDGEKNNRTFSQEEALSNATNKKNNYFVVKRIL